MCQSDSGSRYYFKMQYNIVEKAYYKKLADLFDPAIFLLFHKISHNYIDIEPITYMALYVPEQEKPVAVMLYEEHTINNGHVYLLEVHPDYRLKDFGSVMINRLKEKYNYIDLTTLKDSKIFYEKLGFVEEEDNHMVWRKEF